MHIYVTEKNRVDMKESLSRVEKKVDNAARMGIWQFLYTIALALVFGGLAIMLVPEETLTEISLRPSAGPLFMGLGFLILFVTPLLTWLTFYISRH